MSFTSLRKNYRDGQVTIEVARIEDFEVTSNLFGHMEDLRGILDEIPALYRASTEIDLRSWNDEGGYPSGALFVSYTRPATPEEVEEERVRQAAAVGSELQCLQRNIEGAIARAKAAGVDPAEIGIASDDARYIIRR